MRSYVLVPLYFLSSFLIIIAPLTDPCKYWRVYARRSGFVEGSAATIEYYNKFGAMPWRPLKFDDSLEAPLPPRKADVSFRGTKLGLDTLFGAPESATYLNLTTFAFIAALLCIILAALAYSLSLAASQDTEKRSEYECGFAPFDSATRHPFEVHFYVVGILFLIFDVEISLLFPWILTVEAVGLLSYLVMFQFVYILAVGFHYEWKRGALIWPARYAPARLTLASGKWLLFVAALYIYDVTYEALLLAPTVALHAAPVDSKPKPKKKAPADKLYWDPEPRWVPGYWHRWVVRPLLRIRPVRWLRRWIWRYYENSVLYGPHPKNSPKWIYWAAREEAAKIIAPSKRPKVFGPLPEGSGEERVGALWGIRDAEERCGADLRRRLRWHPRVLQLWWHDALWIADPMQPIAVRIPFWRYVRLYFVWAAILAVLLLLFALIFEAVSGDLQEEKKAFFRLLAAENAWLIAKVPSFDQLARPFQTTVSFLLMGPRFVWNYVIENWPSLLVATVIYTRLLVRLLVASPLATRARFRQSLRQFEIDEAQRLEEFYASGGVMWLSIPSKRHPDMGQTDEQHDEYVLHIDRILRGEEETYQFRRFGLFPLVISSAAVDDLSCCINSNLATAAAYGAELLTALLPEVTLLSMLVYLIKVIGIELGYGRRKKPLAIETLAAAQEALAFVIWLYLLQVYFTETTPILGGYFFWTSGIVVSKFFVAITSFFILHASEDFLRRNRRHLLEYPVMLLLAILLLLCLIGANNLMTVFLTIGGFSICLYVLILFDVYARTTREAAMKYFYLSAMSAGLIVFGTFLVYSTAGTVMFADLRWIFLTAANNINLVSGAGLAFLLFGLFFKLSAFPAHLWAVEVYEGSPAPVMAFFLLPVKMAVLFLFVRLLNTAFIGLADLWLPCLAVACAGSLLWGAFAALYERKISRFLGYASINQLGYLLMGISCDTDEALRSMYAYLVLYVMMSGGFLFIYMHTRRKGKLNLLYISDFRGFAVQERALSWSLTVFLFSSVGIPPLVGFHAKYIVLAAAMQKELFLLAAIGVAVGLLSAYYYLQFVASFQFEEQNRITPTRCALSEDGRLAVTFVEAGLWVSPLLGPAMLPFFAVVAEAASIAGASR